MEKENIIIYSLVCNEGGMLRVTESLDQIFSYLPKDFPLRLIIFSTSKQCLNENDRLKWIQLGDASDPNHLEKVQSQVQDYLAIYQVTWMIADFMTLDFFKGIECKICYDVHFLGRPFYKALTKDKKAQKISDFLKSHFVLELHAREFKFLKTEFQHLNKASIILSNSPSTSIELETTYIDVTKGKEIVYIPVSSELADEELKSSTKINKNKFYFSGRCHPQKGVHFLFDHNWTDYGLSMRGFADYMLDEKRVDWLMERGITALEWSSDSSTIREDLSHHEIILFPSIYEPWGLALQEALAMGKICFANINVGGHEDQIKHGENGFLIDFSQEHLPEKILEMYNQNMDKIEQIKNNARNNSALGHNKRQEKFAQLLMNLASR